MKYVITLNGKRYEAEVTRVDGAAPFAPAAPFAAAAPVAAPVAPAAAAPAAPVAAAPAAGLVEVAAPMPGTVLDVPCTVGQAVTAGQTVVLLEAMKMENEIVAPQDGVVAEIRVKKGDVVDTDAVMVCLK